MWLKLEKVRKEAKIAYYGKQCIGGYKSNSRKLGYFSSVFGFRSDLENIYFRTGESDNSEKKLY